MKKRIFGNGWLAVAISVICACALCGSIAWASEPRDPEGDQDTSGNILAAGESASYGTETPVPHSIYWAGKDLAVENAEVAGDIIAAGMNIFVDDGAVNGNVRTASQNVRVTGVKVAGDITSVGQRVEVGKDSSCNAAYLAGAEVSFNGTANALGIGGNTVVIAGTVNGDANVAADKVIVEKGAVITGNLTVEAASEPVVDAGAEVAGLDFHKVESEQFDVPAMSGVLGMLGVFGVFAAIISIITSVLVALVLAWIVRRAVKGSGDMVRARPMPMIVTGLVAGIVSIPVLILLFIFVAPIGGATLCALIAILCIAVPFTGASLACTLFPQWNRFGAAALGGLAAGVLAAIPFVGALAGFVSCIYLTGYVLQCLYLDMKAPAVPMELEPVAVPASCVTPEPPVAPVASATEDAE